jgi:hypothetical protein
MENIYYFDDWCNYMLSNSDYNEDELLQFKDYYNNLNDYHTNINEFIKFNELH